MNINSSMIKMQATHSKILTNRREESLRVWVGDRRPDFENRERSGRERLNLIRDSLQLSKEAKKLLANKQVKSTDCPPEKLELSEKDKELIWLLEAFLSQITGKKVKLNIPKEIILPYCSEIVDPALVQDMDQQEAQPVGWGVEYEYHETHYESEKMSFTAEGVIKGNNGHTINFSIEMNMSRQYYSQKDFFFRAGDAKKVDPLVINFNGNIPELTDLKFKFDLNADGKEDQISFLKPGSGFLAFDKNQDGKVTDGSELFGPTTGNGFNELSSYDEDQNGWIDDQDSIFDKLWVWTKDDSGKDKLIAVGEAGIGAIYLGHINTPFELKNVNNQLNGVVQRTGIYVTDNDTVGTVQQIDLTV